jgi:serine/threonine-protein kinase
MPCPIDPSRDLLFGLLALQIGLIDQSKLVAAFQAWTLDKARSLADHLVARCDLDSEQRALLDALVVQHLKKHGDAEKSLAAIPAGRSTRESLAQLGDSDIEGTLGRVGSGSTQQDGEADPDRTATYSVGSATSDGQRFRILRPHARGGLGAVFVALDAELHREVALKQILDSHADDPTSRQRFLLEAEVTGRLEHPGIVPVYGLGTYGDGRPYYAMRFIRGDSLKEAIEHFHADETWKQAPGRRSLELSKLLRRFLDVCNAIDYAHSRGVLHRDIKPANVILGRHGETLVVDWGLAKTIGRSDPGSGERTLVPSSASGSAETLPGSALGTPAYMSPEQAEGDLSRLGPRSDVYSLGATLYCLLTGRPPLEGDIADVVRAVQKGDFLPPRQVDTSIDRALEAVCLKAMSLKPEDRYATPKFLADEIERWLAGEPVSAWPEPWTARARRRLARHRTLVAAGAAAVAVAIAGLAAVLIVQAHDNQRLVASNDQLRAAVDREQRAVRQVQSAMDREMETNRRLTIAHAQERKARQQAQEQFALALDAVENATRAASDNALLDPALGAFHRKNLELALGFYKRLRASLEERTVEGPKARADLGMAYHRMASVSDRLGAHDEARQAFRAAIALRGGLVRDQPAVVQHRRDLADSYAESGRSLCDTGRSTEGLGAYRRAIELWEQLARESPGTDAAIGLSRTFHSLGYCHVHAGRTDEALRVFRRALEIRERLTRDHPEVPQYRVDLAATLRIMGGCYSLSDRSAEAIEAYRKAQAILERQIQADPADLASRSSLAVIINNMGIDQLERGRPDQALPLFRRYLAIHQELVKADLTNSHYRQMLAYAHSNVGTAQAMSARYDEALQAFRDALALHEALALAYPGQARFQDDLIRIRALMAAVRAATGRTSEARADLREAERILGQAPAPGLDTLVRLAGAYAKVSASAGADERRAYADRAMAILRRAVAAGWHGVDDLQSDPIFVPLRSRPDFQELVMDLSFPADPFSKGRDADR